MKSSLNINLAAKLRGMGQSGHVERMEDVRNAYDSFPSDNIKEEKNWKT